MNSKIGFHLDARLASESTLIADIGFSQLRICHDARFPWLMLVPKLNDLVELDDLQFEQQIQVLKCTNIVSQAMRNVYNPDKLNTAAIGNIVKQLHIHLVARFEYDDVWPAPVWGNGNSVAYKPDSLNSTIKKLQSAIEQVNQGEMYVNYYHQ